MDLPGDSTFDSQPQLSHVFFPSPTLHALKSIDSELGNSTFDVGEVLLKQIIE